VRLDRNIAVTLLRDPELAARTGMDDEGLRALADSIRDVGVIEPLIVKPLGDGTYEVVAGHRRLCAARALNLADVPCRLVLDAATAEAVKIHENLLREDLSPADEGQFYLELYEKNGQDTDRVAAIVRRPRAHVERRMLLFGGNALVLEALRAGDITLGVAEEFNRIERPEDVVFYLDYARRGGCSVRQAREWRAQANARASMAAAAEASSGGAVGPASPVPAASDAPPDYIHAARPYELTSGTELRPCLFCGDEFPEWKMYRKFVCAADAAAHHVFQQTAGDRPRQPVELSPRVVSARESRSAANERADGEGSNVE
jgi:ParB/RepB/Spo0J family partition protein